MLGAPVSAGFLAGISAEAAARLEGFLAELRCHLQVIPAAPGP